MTLRMDSGGEAFSIDGLAVSPANDSITLTFYCHSVGLALHSVANPADSTRRWHPTAGDLDGRSRCDVVGFTRRLGPRDTLSLREVAPRVPLRSQRWDSLPVGVYRLYARIHVAKGVRVNLGITPEGKRLNGPEGPPFMVPIGRATVE